MLDRHSNRRAFWKYQEGDVYHLTFDNDDLGYWEEGALIRRKEWTGTCGGWFFVSCEQGARSQHDSWL